MTKKNKELIATYNGKSHHLISFEGYEPCTDAKEESPTPPTAKPGRPVKAQVSTPQDHVFAQGSVRPETKHERLG